MRSEAELWALLREAYGMPFGSAQIALVEQIIQHADAAGLDELRFAARMQATTSYVHGGEPAKSFVTFSWCLSEYDKHPDRHDREDESLLLWHFKYMVGGLTKFPEVPLQRTYDVLDDMERRFRAGGHSLHAVYQHRWVVASHIGDPSADEWFAKWSAAPRDRNSDCDGCDPTSKVEHLAERGRDEEAVTLARPVLAGRLTCVEQPQSILTELLFPYLRTGRLDEAADAHRRAYRRLRGNIADLAGISTHIAFCASTGNETRGLELVERHLSWLDSAPSPYAAMWFAASSALLLDRLAGRHPDVTLRRTTGVLGTSLGVEVPVGELAEELATYARGIAARFDARNGSSYVGDQVAARLAASPVVEYLPLSAVDQAAMAAPATVSRPAPDPLPDEPTALLDHAEHLLRLHRTDEAKAAWHAFDERHPAPEPALAARRLDGRALSHTVDERFAEAEADFREAAATYRAAGDELSALVSQARGLALAAFDPERFALALSELEELTDTIEGRAEPDRRAAARLRLATALGRAERFEEALRHLERAGREPVTDKLLAAEIIARRAHCLLLLERFDDCREAATEARRRYAEFDDPPVTAVVCLVLGHAHANRGRMAEAVAAFDEGVRLASDRDVGLSARIGRGRARLAAGEPLAAIADLVESVAEHVAKGEDGPAAMLRFDLATAYQAAGQLLDAAEAAESAVDTLDRLGAQDPADRARYLLSRVYRELGEHDRGVELLEQLADNLDGFDNLPARGQMLEEAAQVLYEIDRDAQAAQRFIQAAEAYRAAGLPLDELRARRWRALALRWADDADGSIAALAEADTLAATVAGADDPEVIWERAMLGYDGARVYIGAGRLDEAMARIEGVAEAFRGIEAFGEALHADLLRGELLLRMDRPVAAEPVLRQVLGSAPHDSQARENAAWLLSETLEAQGRKAEAEDLRREHGLDT
jgi:tetratricopeptide (TPR) repeat protein